MSISLDYEEEDLSCSSASDCQHVHEFSQFMSRELISSLQRELGTLPESELNESMRSQILHIVTRTVPRVQENYQTVNSVDLTQGGSEPSFDPNLSLPYGMLQELLPTGGTLTMSNHTHGMFLDMSSVPWAENMGNGMSPYCTGFSDSSQQY